jgi:hypothetical protein
MAPKSLTVQLPLIVPGTTRQGTAGFLMTSQLSAESSTALLIGSSPHVLRRFAPNVNALGRTPRSKALQVVGKAIGKPGLARGE